MGLFGNRGIIQRNRYRRHVQRMLREKLESGELNSADYDKASRAILKNSTVEKLIAESRGSGQDGSNLKGAFSWVGIWEWIQENWLEILKLVITIAIMFAEDENEKKFYGTGLSGDYDA